MNDKSKKGVIQKIEGETKRLLEKLFLSDFSSLQTQIGRYDNHSLLIKGWAITLWSGFMYFIIREEVYELFIIQIIILLIFWSFDALFKFYQRKLALRADEIRENLKGYKLNIAGGELNFIWKEKNTGENENDIDIINPREDFKNTKADQRKKLRRCILLRVVSIVYIYLISANFLISVYIIESIDQISFIIILIFSLVILCFGIFNYVVGIDDFIEENKIIYLSFFYISIIAIIANLLILGQRIFIFQ